jgi:hypothetical protein
MLSINLQGWNQLTDEQRTLVNKLICELGDKNGDKDCLKSDHKDHEHLEMEHWYTGEL